MVLSKVMVFCYQNFSDILWEKNVLETEKNFLKFEAEGQEFANFLRSLEQFIQTVTECFFNLFLEVSHNSLEQLEFKLEKIIGIYVETCRKS